MKKRFLYFIVALLLLFSSTALAEIKYISRPFDMSCDIFIEYLKLTMGDEVDDNKIYIKEGLSLDTENSNILIIKDDTPVFPKVNQVGISVRPSRYDHPSDCAVSLTSDAISVYRALTECKSNNIKELYDTFLSLGIIDATLNGTPVKSAYTLYEDSLFALNVDYETDIIQYIIMKNPFVETPKFKEFENNTEGENNQ